jgi:DNA-binding transcriptional regulator YdaS (Cro superfamily)
MDLKTYLTDGKERGFSARFAEAIDVSPSFLSQMAAGSAPISPARCVQIEQASAGAVTRKDLRPDDWNLIWPELEGQAA